MAEIEDRNRLINEILAHQSLHEAMEEKERYGGGDVGQQNTGQMKHVHIPDRETLDKFRELVNCFIQADDFKKKLQIGVKEQNARVKKLSNSILTFMAKYNIEDLKASNGIRLRYKKTIVNEPLSAKRIKERIEENPEFFKNKTSEEIAKELFQRGKVEKISLRRLKRNTLEV